MSFHFQEMPKSLGSAFNIRDSALNLTELGPTSRKIKIYSRLFILLSYLYSLSIIAYNLGEISQIVCDFQTFGYMSLQVT